MSLGRWALAGLMCVAVVGCGTSPAGPAQPKVPRFAYTRCPFTPIYPDVRCGRLSVPEIHGTANGRTLSLAVAIFKSRVNHPFPDPVVFLMGGPGLPALDSLGRIIDAANGEEIVGDRDLVLIDYRGIGYSRPAAGCPQVRPIEDMPLSVQREGATASLAAEVNEYRQCRDRLVHEGIDLGAYTTAQIAADVAGLRTALGYRSINLDGVSYGTRLALAIMRDHPQGIRSIILDSVVPPQWDDAMAIRQRPHAWATLFAGCAAAPTCRRQYPHLAQTFARSIARLQIHPLVAHPTGHPPLLLTGTELARDVFNALYIVRDIPLLPAMLTELAAGKQTSLDRILPDVESGFFSVKGQALGMKASVDCSEEIEPASTGQIAAAVRTLPRPLEPETVQAESTARAICASWGVGAVSSGARLPVHSAIPTLILDGQYDPITPPAYGALVQKTLSHAYRFVYPGYGHGIRWDGTCVSDMTWAFLDHPTQKPDAACISGIVPAFF